MAPTPVRQTCLPALALALAAVVVFVTSGRSTHNGGLVGFPVFTKSAATTRSAFMPAQMARSPCMSGAGRVSALMLSKAANVFASKPSLMRVRSEVAAALPETPEMELPDPEPSAAGQAGVDYQVGDTVLSKFSEDGLWYHTEIREVISPGQTYLVYYSDYGNEEERDVADMKPDDGSGEVFEYVEPKIGEIYDGEVVGVRPFGIFVNFGAERDGMVHISQIAPWRIEDPGDLVSAGDPVRVKLLDIRDDGKLQLTMKGLNPDMKAPQGQDTGNMPEEGTVHEGKVVSIRPFGAFVSFGFSRDGLVHVSQMADYHVSDPEDVLAVGDKVKVLVKSVEPSGRIALTLKGEGLGVLEFSNE